MKAVVLIAILFGFSTLSLAHECDPNEAPNDYCRIRPLWQGEEFEGFTVTVRRDVWQKFLIKDYGNNRDVAYRIAKRELETIRFDGMCD